MAFDKAAFRDLVIESVGQIDSPRLDLWLRLVTRTIHMELPGMLGWFETEIFMTNNANTQYTASNRVFNFSKVALLDENDKYCDDLAQTSIGEIWGAEHRSQYNSVVTAPTHWAPSGVVGNSLSFIVHPQPSAGFAARRLRVCGWEVPDDPPVGDTTGSQTQEIVGHLTLAGVLKWAHLSKGDRSAHRHAAREYERSLSLMKRVPASSAGVYGGGHGRSSNSFRSGQ